MTERILNDRYALDSKVGEGGMAVTYRARDLLLNRTVAVKLMREQFTSDPQFVERFRREAQAAARLSHDNIAGVYDTGQANGTHYIVMEFVEGADLKQRLRREGPLPLLTALEIGRQIAAALDAAHRGGLVHRDIKPHNVLLNQDGKVKVTDFGIAKLASEGEDTGVIIGSVHYISPEQARGEVTTPSSDLYSLGAVLFEMLTGRTVFEAENAMAVAHKQIYDRPPALRSLRPDIPPAVESMVLRCLEKDPRARYQSAAELQGVIVQLINQLAQEETIVISPAAPSMDATMVFRAPVDAPKPVDPLSTRRPAYEEEEPRGGKGWLIALVFVVLAIATGFGAFQLLSSGGKRHVAVNPNAQMVIVPNLVGYDEQAARAMLERIDLRVKVNAEFNDDVAKGQVFSQRPSSAVQVKKGTVVMISVSDGPATYLLPDVTGKSLNEAKSLVREIAGSGVSLAVESEYADLPKGQVVRTAPPADSIVSRSTKVQLIISKGPENKRVVKEEYTDTVPNIGDVEEVFVRVEFERPAGSEPQMIWEGTLKPGESIPVQRFDRNEDEKVIVRLLAGKDADSLAVMGERPFGPSVNATTQSGE